MGKEKKLKSKEDTSKKGVLLEKAAIEFDDSYVEELRLFFEMNEKKKKPLSQTKCFEEFAIEHGFTKGQVKGQYFSKIHKVSQQQADKEMKQAHQDMVADVKKEVMKKDLKKKRKRNDSDESSNDELSDESQTDDDVMPETPSKFGKKEKEEGTFKPFRFASSTSRIYLYRYPTHYKFKLQRSPKKKNHFEIDVLVDTKVTVDQLKLLGESVVGPKLVSEGDRQNESFMIYEQVRGDVEMRTLKGGPVRIGEERWYMVFIEKKHLASVQLDDVEWGGIDDQESLGGVHSPIPIQTQAVKESQDTETKDNE